MISLSTLILKREKYLKHLIGTNLLVVPFCGEQSEHKMEGTTFVYGEFKVSANSQSL